MAAPTFTCHWWSARKLRVRNPAPGDAVFEDSHELLVLNILEDQGVEASELKRLRQLLQTKEVTGKAK